MPALILAAAIVLFIALTVAFSYNRFVRQRQLVTNSWSNVDTELRRRYDLIPNLVETVRGYASHEHDTLEAVTQARAVAVASNGGAATQQRDENVLVDSLKQLFAVSERYPDLKASEQFLRLQQELVSTEDRIQAARRFYNGNVRDLNQRVESFPSMLIAKLFGFQRADFFQVEPAVRAAGAPTVQLD